MTTPRVTRPQFPRGYVDNPRRLLDWESVQQKLSLALHYWLCSVRPNGRPHAIPKWAVWVDDRIYFDGSPQTRHARNIAQNPFVSLHLESGEAAVILEGVAKELKPSRQLAGKIARAYADKYASLGYSPEVDTWDQGGLFEVVPRTIIAWNQFAEDPTKFVFETDAD